MMKMVTKETYIIGRYEDADGSIREVPVDVELHYITEADDVPEVVTWLRKHDSWGLDCETDGSGPDGLDPFSKKIATIQVGNPMCDEPRAYVLCVRSLGDAIQPILDEIRTSNAKKFGQNLNFECRWLQYKWGIRLKNVVDCQIMELICRAGLYEGKGKKGSPYESEDDGATPAAYKATSMAMLCRRHLGVSIDKEDWVRRSFWTTKPGQLNERQLKYAAGDVIYVFYIANAQKPMIRDRGLSSIIKLEHDVLPILADSELYGICIDENEWRALWQEAIVKKAAAKAALDDLFRSQSTQKDLFSDTQTVRPVLGTKEINYDAPTQVQAAIKRYCKQIGWTHRIVTSFEELLELKEVLCQGWIDWRQRKEFEWAAKEDRKPEKITAKDVPDHQIPEDSYCILVSLDANVLKIAKLRKQLPANLVDTYLEYKAQAKKASTYGIDFLKRNLKKQTGRIHATWHQALTTTGRLSSRVNLQNLPADDPRYRACFKPAPGQAFLIYDFSSIEPRLSAEYSQDPVYLQTFRENKDLYCAVGEAMLNRPVDKKKDKSTRQSMKSIVLGSAYMMGARKLRDDLTLKQEEFIERGEVHPPTFEEARALRDQYFRIHKGIADYQDACVERADPSVSKRKIHDEYKKAPVTYIEGLCGRKRFFALDEPRVASECVNHGCQGTSATILKLATVMFQQEADALGVEVHFLVYAHDELVVSVPAERALELSKLLKQCMEDAGRKYIKSVPVIAEAANETGVWDHWHKER